MKALLIVHHSVTGGTLQMAQAAARGARHEPGVAVRLEKAVAAGAQELLAADGYLFAAPENLAAISGLMKDFFDRTYYAVLDRIQGRPYAMLVCAGSDGTNAARQMERIATGWRLRAIAPPLSLHACSDSGGDPRAQADRRRRPRALRGARRDAGGGPEPRDFLMRRRASIPP